MNPAELPDSIVELSKLSPDKGAELVRKFIRNDDRAQICQILSDYARSSEVGPLVDALGNMIDLAREEGYMGRYKPKD
tara:strand:+ start:480 stop:713 length:234 start_codon:yes stop_codon:yes gene_type:complete